MDNLFERDPLTDKIYGALMMYHQETLRDQLAMAAAPVLLREGRAGPNESGGYFEAVSVASYRFADAMLEARTTEGQKP